MSALHSRVAKTDSVKLVSQGNYDNASMAWRLSEIKGANSSFVCQAWCYFFCLIQALLARLVRIELY